MAEALPDAFAAVADGLDQAEHLGNALDREGRTGIAGDMHLAVVAIHGDAQLSGHHAGQCGNVISHLALADQWANFIENFVQQRLHAQAREGAGLARQV